MSGFAGVFHLDGAPVEPAWLEVMADFLAFRGPDASQVWVSGSAGLCHTLLRTSAETDGRSQITSLDADVWIAGDVRIDDRETLFAKLAVPNEILKSACSAELVLHAYAKWGEDCVEHLLGDFSFVIWDARQKQVFAARDQLGIKPLIFAQVGPCLLVSNTLDCIRQIPIVPDELNERAIGDLLIAGGNRNPATTFFAEIRRLPAAHKLIAGADRIRTERYWTPPIDEPLYYHSTGDYVDHFHELLRAAVRDRLPDGPLGIFMSGGLDSPAVAATAVRLGARPTAFTSVYDRLIPDEERYYSGLVATYLGIPIRYNVRDDEPWGWDPDSAPIHTAEPTLDPLGLVSSQQYYFQISEHARIFFFGNGPDVALQYEWRSHLNYLKRQRRWGRLSKDLALHFKAFKRVPLLPTLPRMWRERTSNQPDWYDETIPPWLNPEFEARLRLTERWTASKREALSPNPIRPKSYASFTGDFPICGGGNDGYARAEIDERHPLGDLRLVRFLLAVPAIPWCREKYLIRKALAGILPEGVRRRPKAPLAGFPDHERARCARAPELPSLPALKRYVDIRKLPAWPGQTREEFDCSRRVLSLHYWLLGL